MAGPKPNSSDQARRRAACGACSGALLGQLALESKDWIPATATHAPCYGNQLAPQNGPGSTSGPRPVPITAPTPATEANRPWHQTRPRADASGHVGTGTVKRRMSRCGTVFGVLSSLSLGRWSAALYLDDGTTFDVSHMGCYAGRCTRGSRRRVWSALVSRGACQLSGGN